MLILYKKSERQFLSNGIGRLDKHAFDDKVREELNGIYKLEFTYPIHAPHSKDIKNDNIVRATVPDGEQPFFISRIVKKDGYLRVTAYHLFYRLIWQLIEDINIVNLNGQAALNRVLENTEFTGVSDIATTKNIRIVRYNAVEAILNPGKDNTLISRFGGELKRDKLTVMLMNRIGRTYENNPVEIRYAKNLLSYEADIDSTNVATRVMPIGFDGLLLPEKYVVKPGADPTDYKTAKVEYSSIRAISNPDNPKEGELPLEDAYEALRQAVLSDFESGRFDLKASYQVRFQELSTTEEYKNKSVLEKVYLGDEIKVIHTDEDLQILSKVVAYEWSPIRKEYDEVELGSHIDTFSDIKPTLELIAGKVEQYKTDWENNVDEITELLTTALGGYVLKRPGELLIMDTEDPATATKVWRWNLNGLGYSGTGINGPYETAITMDGRIIAKFIYTLNLSSISADLGVVTAGRIQDKDNESYWDLDGKVIKLNVNELKITGNNVATQSYADQAERDAKTYADGLKLAIDTEINDIETSVDNLSTTINTTFKDGVIQEAEAKSIEKYINSLNTEKADLDAKYTKVYNDTQLTGTPKTDLASKKTAYNTAYTNLINSINAAIADGKTTSAEKTDVDNKFTAYRTALSNLSTSFETAVNAIAQKKVDVAQAVNISRFESNETLIQQNTDAISLKAEKTEVEGKILKQSTAPTHEADRLWLDTSVTPNVLKRSNGTDWVKVTPTTGSEIGLSDIQITAKVEANSTQLAKKSEVVQTADDLTALFNSKVVGGRNLLRDSGRVVENSSYGMANYYFTDPPVAGEKITVSLKGQLAATKSYFRIYNSGGTVSLATLIDKGNGIYQATFDWVIGSSSNTYITVYAFTNAQTGTSRIDWIKLEKGNTPTDWSPAPEELYTGITRIDKDGINVSKSTSEINSQLANDGLTVRDGEKDLASFGESGAVIPDADIANLKSPRVMQLTNPGTYTVGSGGTFLTLQEAFDRLFIDGNRFLNDQVLLLVYGQHSGDINMSDIYGGSIIVRLMDGAKIYGSFIGRNMYTALTIESGGTGRGYVDGVDDYPFQFSRCFNVVIENLDLSGVTTGMFANATNIVTRGLDFGTNKFYYGIVAERGSNALMINNRGRVTGNRAEVRNAVIYQQGEVPFSGLADSILGGAIINTAITEANSSYNPPAITSKTFTHTFRTATFDTIQHGTSTVSAHYGATAAQNRWDSSNAWYNGRIRFGSEVYNFFNGGSAISIRMRLRRKNSSHGNSGAVTPAPYNHSASYPSGATRGGWTGWATVPSSLFTSGGATLTYYNGVQGINGYAIWDAVEVEVTVTKNV